MLGSEVVGLHLCQAALSEPAPLDLNDDPVVSRPGYDYMPREDLSFVRPTLVFEFWSVSRVVRCDARARAARLDLG